MKALDAFYALYANVLVEKTYTCCKKQKLKSETQLHILYATY